MSPVDLSLIRTDGGTQPRAAIDSALVQSYAEDMAAGATFPPLVAYFDGVAHWLADGFHRYFAAKGCGLAEFNCDVRQGTVRDAILYSVSANAAHGLRRTNEDKRRAVLTLLNDPEWGGWSDREIARLCAVSPQTVGNLRPSPSIQSGQIERTVHRGGATYQVNTANIGARPRVIDRPVFDATDAGRDTSAPPPPTPQQVQAVRQDWEAGRGVATDLRMIFEAASRLPSAPDAASTFPRSIRHTFTPRQARELASWLTAFASAWEQNNGEQNVAA